MPQKFLFSLAELSVSMFLLIPGLLLFTKLAGRRFTAGCRYILWTLVILRLCIPVSVSGLPAFWEIRIPGPAVLTETDFVSIDDIPQPEPDSGTAGGGQSSSLTESIPVDEVRTAVGEEAQRPTAKQNFPILLQPDKIFSLILGIWLVTAGVLFSVRIGGYLFFAGTLRRTWQLPAKEQSEICRRLGIRLGIPEKRIPPLYISKEVHSPMLCGFRKPVILLPDIPMTENQLTGILAHELTHFRRRDLWIRLACAAAVSLYWFHPLVYTAADRCCREMELSCDEAVLAGKDEPVRTTYGKVMLDIIRRCSIPPSGLTTHFNPRSSAVMERFECILDGSVKIRGTGAVFLMCIACAAAGSLVAVQEAEIPFAEPIAQIFPVTEDEKTETDSGSRTVEIIPGAVYESFGGTLTEYAPRPQETLDMSVAAEGKLPLPQNTQADLNTLYSRYQTSYLGAYTRVFAVTGALFSGNDPAYAYVYRKHDNGDWTVTPLPAPEGTLCKGVVLRGIPTETGNGWLLGLLADNGSIVFFRSDDGSSWTGGSTALHPLEGKSWLVQYSRHSGVGGETLCLVFDSASLDKEQIWLSFDWGNTFVCCEIPITETLTETYTDLQYLGKSGGRESGAYSLYFLAKGPAGNQHIRYLSSCGAAEGTVSLYTYNADPPVRTMISEYRYNSAKDNGGIFWNP